MTSAAAWNTSCLLACACLLPSPPPYSAWSVSLGRDVDREICEATSRSGVVIAEIMLEEGQVRQ